MPVSFRQVTPKVHVISRVGATGWCHNTILISLDGGLAVYSPTRDLGEDIHARIVELGRPRYLVAANDVHHLGLEEWRQRYPEADVFARPQAITRLARLYPALPFRPIHELPARSELSYAEPDGTKDGEVWLCFKGGWIVGDAFFNVRPPLSGVFGFVLRMTGTAPGFKIGRMWAPLHLRDRRSYRRWLLQELDRAPPSWLVPAHGDPIWGSDLAEQLRGMADRVLG